MITKSTIKEWAALKGAAARRESGLFLIEGTRAVTDTAGLFDCEAVIATDKWMREHPGESERLRAVGVPARDLERVSSATTPQGVVAVCRIPRRELREESLRGSLVVALDTIQDPGNLGTIIRTADWMGVDHILASPGTADCYAPKVVQATMGSLSRVAVHYCDLPETLGRLRSLGMAVMATALGGESLYAAEAPGAPGVVVVTGNEGRGISPEVLGCATMRVAIPPFPAGSAPRCESLNAAVATAIVLSHLRERMG